MHNRDMSYSLAGIVGALGTSQVHDPTLSLQGPVRASRCGVARQDITLRRVSLMSSSSIHRMALFNPGYAFLLVAMSQRCSHRNVRPECLATVLLMERMSIPAWEREKTPSASLRRGNAIEDTCDRLFNI